MTKKAGSYLKSKKGRGRSADSSSGPETLNLVPCDENGNVRHL